ncbi:MAG: hypothetical protein JSV58_05720, partial [Candidatus Bathyarchaeota archaeon]
IATLLLASFCTSGLATFQTEGIPTHACLQDQYGNVYDFEVDLDHNYIYGLFYSNQGCDAPIWPLTGSFARGEGWMIELTGANPLGDSDPSCVPVFKVKGIYPNAAWYYADGYGGQEFTWTHCGAAITEDAGQGGIFGVNDVAKDIKIALPPSACLQDQYGSLYEFNIDPEHRYLYGQYICNQDCEAKIWYLLGSYVFTAKGPMIELTAANPLGEADPFCVTTFKVKGIYPNAAWYYEWGYGAQEFTWIRC